MKRLLLFITTIALLISCSDSTDSIGMSLINGTSEDVDVAADVFNVASNSVLAENIISRSSTCYLGRIKDPETSTYVTCNFMTQLSGRGATQIADSTSKGLDITTVEADSCELCVYFTKQYGDSLQLMKVVAHELQKPFEESQKYSCDIDSITKKDYVRQNGGLHIQNSYTFSNRVYSAKQRSNSAYPYISFSLNDPYTDLAGTTYKNYGTYLLRKAYANRTNCANDYWFLHNVCPGFYIETVGGIGNIATIFATQIVVYYHNGSGTKGYLSFPGTEETLQKTAIIQDEDKIEKMMADSSCTYLKTPAALFTELTIPVDSIMQGHESDTLSTTRIFIPRINNNKLDTYNLPTPQTLLLLPTDSVTSFFANRKVNDSKTSYTTTYSSSYNGYTFGNISTLVSKMYKNGNRSSSTWNKVTIIPVETTTSTLSSGSSIVTKVTYDMSLGSTRLKKGSIDNSNIKASCIYSHFK